MCDITIGQALIFVIVVWVIFGIIIYKKSDGMGIE
jgi:hypothetical protein